MRPGHTQELPPAAPRQIEFETTGVDSRLNRNTFCSGTEVAPVQCARGFSVILITVDVIHVHFTIYSNMHNLPKSIKYPRGHSLLFHTGGSPCQQFISDPQILSHSFEEPQILSLKILKPPAAVQSKYCRS